MGDGSAGPLRGLPRAFVPGIPDPAPEVIELPKEERRKFHDVLRLGKGDEVVLMPGDGRAIRCVLDGVAAEPISTIWPNTESPRRVTLALGLPKPDSMEAAVRMAAEMGVCRVILFPCERSVVRWNEAKWESRIVRMAAIAREACEVAFRPLLPAIERRKSLADVLKEPGCQVLSEYESVGEPLRAQMESCLVIGPEGGWSQREAAQIGAFARTLGPRVMRVDTAAAAATAIALLAPVDLPA
jgi:16S rRNA (uracil1498-N3)-methyltransferase